MVNILKKKYDRPRKIWIDKAAKGIGEVHWRISIRDNLFTYLIWIGKKLTANYTIMCFFIPEIIVCATNYDIYILFDVSFVLIVYAIIIITTCTEKDYFREIEDNPKYFLSRQEYLEYRIIHEKSHELLGIPIKKDVSGNGILQIEQNLKKEWIEHITTINTITQPSELSPEILINFGLKNRLLLADLKKRR